jgi:HlyD family secretion protein
MRNPEAEIMKSLFKFVSLLTAFLVGFVVSNALAGDTALEQPKPPTVSVSSVVERQMSEKLFINGSVVPVEEVAVGADVSGLLVLQLMAEIGDNVKEGDILAKLDKSALETQLAQIVAQEAQVAASVAQAEAQIVDAEIGVKQAKEQWGRADTLAKRGVGSAATKDSAKNSFDSANAKLNTANQGLVSAKAQSGLLAAQKTEVQLRISKADVRAPSDGLILSRNAQLGAVVSGAGGPLFRLARNGVYEVVADVPEDALVRLADNMPAEIGLTGLSEPLRGKVRRVDPEIDAVSRLGKVRVWLETDAKIRPGAFANVIVLTADRTALSVPASALVYSGRDAFLQIVKEGLVETRKVKTGIRAGKFIEISEGVNLDEDVVERAGTFIANGDKVTAVMVEDETGALQ